jgi:hypothetical protein
MRYTLHEFYRSRKNMMSHSLLGINLSIISNTGFISYEFLKWVSHPFSVLIVFKNFFFPCNLQILPLLPPESISVCGQTECNTFVLK